MGRVAVVGGYGVGLTVRCRRAPGSGQTTLGRSWVTGHGGKGSNQAIAASRLGAAVTLLTAVGPDEHGRAAELLWTAEGVRATVRQSPAPTMMGLILVEDGGDNRIVVVPGALADLGAADVAGFGAQIAGADVVVTGLETPAPLALAALRAARAAGVRTILNPSPADAAPENLWLAADVMVTNLDECRLLLGRHLTIGARADAGTGIDLARELIDRGAAAAVVTLGARGACWARRERDGSVQAAHQAARVAPEVGDTTGAGDAFLGALAALLSDGRDLPGAVAVAVDAGSYAVCHPGVVTGLPTAEQLHHFRSGPALPPSEIGPTRPLHPSTQGPS